MTGIPVRNQTSSDPSKTSSRRTDAATSTNERPKPKKNRVSCFFLTEMSAPIRQVWLPFYIFGDLSGVLVWLAIRRKRMQYW